VIVTLAFAATLFAAAPGASPASSVMTATSRDMRCTAVTVFFERGHVALSKAEQSGLGASVARLKKSTATAAVHAVLRAYSRESGRNDPTVLWSYSRVEAVGDYLASSGLTNDRQLLAVEEMWKPAPPAGWELPPEWEGGWVTVEFFAPQSAANQACRL
jgi:hypothetical protein